MLEFVLTIVLHVIDKLRITPALQWIFEEVPYKMAHVWRWYFRNPLTWFNETSVVLITNHTKWPSHSIYRLNNYEPGDEPYITLNTYDTKWIVKPTLIEWLESNGPYAIKVLMDYGTGDIHVQVKFVSAGDAVLCRLLWS